MSPLPTPTRGMPIDTEYIYNIVAEITRIAGLVGSNAVQSQINNGYDQTQSPRTPDVKIHAQTVKISSNLKVSAGSTETKTITFTPPFKIKPVVTATIVATNTTDSAQTANVVLKDISASSATIVVEFANKGVASVDVNVIAVGIPAATVS